MEKYINVLKCIAKNFSIIEIMILMISLKILLIKFLITMIKILILLKNFLKNIII